MSNSEIRQDLVCNLIEDYLLFFFFEIIIIIIIIIIINNIRKSRANIKTTSNAE